MNEDYTPDSIPNLLHTTQKSFQDAQGRTVLLRGVNLSGKQPPNQPSHDASWHLDKPSNPDTATEISFVGAPFPLDEAQVHIARLKAWGFRAVRLAVSWEALEHSGPKKYSEPYIDFLISLLRLLKDASFRVFIDPHQDVFSRSTGGSGAPYWAIEACGLNPKGFQATQASLVHGNWRGPTGDGELDVESWPDMLWQTNLFRLASLTCFTMFFGGRTYAPKCIIDGMNIQDWLQSHMIDAFGHLADRIKDAGDLLDVCVIGWDSMNEPSNGFIGLPNLEIIAEEQTFRKGPTPSLLQTLRMGMGRAENLALYDFGMTGSKQNGHVFVDPRGQTCWLDPSMEPQGESRWGWKRGEEWPLGTCPWALNGVWTMEAGEVIAKNYFALSDPLDSSSAPVDFLQDHWVPHWRAWNARIRRSHPLAIAFVNPPVFSEPPSLDEDDQEGRVCLSPHFYDGLTLLNKRFHSFNADSVGILRKTVTKVKAVKFGFGSIRSSMQDQLGSLTNDSDTDPKKGFSSYAKDGSREDAQSYPSVIGEIGVPFDMKHDDKLFGLIAKGGSEKGYHSQESALDTSLNACDGSNSLGFFIWGYEPSNTNELGDLWNGEDLSLFTSTDYHTLHPPGSGLPTDVLSLLTHGARAIRAFSRPYPRLLVGSCVLSEFSIAKASYKMHVEERQPARSAEGEWSEMYLPYLQFGRSMGRVAKKDKEDEEGFAGTYLKFSRGVFKKSARLLGAEDPDPPLGLTRWSASDTTRSVAQLDVRFSVHLHEGHETDDELEILCAGQWVRWRWISTSFASGLGKDDEKEGEGRRYSIKVKRWFGEGGEETAKNVLT